MVRYSIGDRVAQSEYGPGTVTSANEFHTVIDFDEHGPKTFATGRVRLAPSSTPAPARPAARARGRKKART